MTCTHHQPIISKQRRNAFGDIATLEWRKCPLYSTLPQSEWRPTVYFRLFSHAWARKRWLPI